jgi:hypothetical protein
MFTPLNFYPVTLADAIGVLQKTSRASLTGELLPITYQLSAITYELFSQLDELK